MFRLFGLLLVGLVLSTLVVANFSYPAMSKENCDVRDSTTFYNPNKTKEENIEALSEQFFQSLNNTPFCDSEISIDAGPMPPKKPTKSLIWKKKQQKLNDQNAKSKKKFAHKSDKNLCLDWINKPSYNIHQNARDFEIKRRGVDCQIYGNIAEARQKAHQGVLNALKKIDGSYAYTTNAQTLNTPPRSSTFVPLSGTSTDIGAVICKYQDGTVMRLGGGQVCPLNKPTASVNSNSTSFIPLSGSSTVVGGIMCQYQDGTVVRLGGGQACPSNRP